MNSSVLSSASKAGRKSKVEHAEIRMSTGLFKGDDEDEEEDVMGIQRKSENKAWLALHGKQQSKEFYSVLDVKQVNDLE